MYVWEQPHWPHFEWDESALRPNLHAWWLMQGRVLGKNEAEPGQVDLNVKIDALIALCLPQC